MYGPECPMKTWWVLFKTILSFSSINFKANTITIKINCFFTLSYIRDSLYEIMKHFLDYHEYSFKIKLDFIQDFLSYQSIIEIQFKYLSSIQTQVLSNTIELIQDWLKLDQTKKNFEIFFNHPNQSLKDKLKLISCFSSLENCDNINSNHLDQLRLIIQN